MVHLQDLFLLWTRESRVEGKKEYYCINCETVMDRDCNAAKNILIRFLTTRNERSNVRETLQGLASDPMGLALSSISREF
jgi:transposase